MLSRSTPINQVNILPNEVRLHVSGTPATDLKSKKHFFHGAIKARHDDMTFSIETKGQSDAERIFTSLMSFIAVINGTGLCLHGSDEYIHTTSYSIEDGYFILPHWSSNRDEPKRRYELKHYTFFNEIDYRTNSIQATLL